MGREYFIQPGVEYCPDENMILLMRCPNCQRENYAMAVASGRCYACGFNAHTDPKIQGIIKNINDKLQQQNEDE